jgi:YebC/PmpR family DNA-binding regulatory protein
MSGHSKWATIKHKKGALDAKRGKIFTRLLKEIAVAAKGGGNPDSNARLRTAVLAAKAENMPQDNIKRAILRGTGELEGVSYEEIAFEGYGPGGVAILVQTLSDNKNRTAGEVRHALTKNGGSLGSIGCVSYLFEKKGLVSFSAKELDLDALMEAALEAGAEDVVEGESTVDVVTTPSDFEQVRDTLAGRGFEPATAEISMEPSTTVELAGGDAEAMLRLMDALEDLDDVQDVYANFEISEDELARYA